MIEEKLVEVTILKPSFGEYNNATPVGKKTRVAESVAEAMRKSKHAK